MWTFLGFIGFVVGIIALIKGKMPKLKIHNRKVAAIVLAVSLVVMIAGAESPDKTPEESITEPGETIEGIGEDEEEIDEDQSETETNEPESEHETELESESESEPPGEPSADPASSAPSTTTPSGQLKAHFIDVGQGDSILVQTPEKNILIDGGTKAAGSSVVNYIKKQGIDKLDMVISTHPHEDHIGGLISVLQAFPVAEIIDPAVAHTTKTFEEYLTLIDQKDIKFTEGRAGMSRDLGGDAKMELLHPSSPSSSDLNNASIVARVTFGQVSFLFSGDAESKAESQILDRGYTLASTILKVGHHGSRTSTSQTYLNTVKPKAAVIMCGKDNTYGHPHEETLQKLAAAEVDIYRTDLHGTVVIQTDGQTYDINVKQPYQYVPQKVPEEPESKPAATTPEQFVGSKKSDKYHYPICRYAESIKPENEIWFDSVQEAKGKGYVPCGVCRPPQ